MIYTLERSQLLSCSLAEAWTFFTDPNNLAKITPPELSFRVLDDFSDQPSIYEGMLINYHVSPLFGIRLKWQTEITHVNEGISFVDTQKKGPYKLWEHRHEFIQEGDFVRMNDRVRYRMPFGFLGSIAHGLIVKKKLQHIFDYRYRVLDNLLNKQAHD
ncbi:SRPBCC family protein [Sphingobacterium oryzagri]|uniref:SRPBCC family protein n=1 Tax=Sphingobacterium oryzagri TaxID=3025669 RepID=A0ABY7WKC5_9SPHI|nr:SRPBCC family protein [Sphingobacterium sp. KACC 22765]WDF70036.1 SRPBCC family protein [Sphingobacterium sp. KACC 22765]